LGRDRGVCEQSDGSSEASARFLCARRRSVESDDVPFDAAGDGRRDAFGIGVGSLRRRR
jgi:hypothetical protein